jgi:dihydroorotate dehydrogenase
MGCGWFTPYEAPIGHNFGVSFYELLQPLLFAMEPEAVHERVLHLIATGLVSAPPFHDDRLVVQIGDMTFPNPIGLAAGFDKNAIALAQWPHFGFGFVEIGTVTALPQKGNSKPRMHRFPADKALINRLGFNNEGAEKIAERLAKSPKLMIPLGVNLGKSKATPLVRAAEDYATSMRHLAAFGDYFVVNVSSPNTPGLRTLQDKDALAEILSAVHTENKRKRPVFVKVAPDLTESALEELLGVAIDQRAAGLIATNTTLSREGLTGGGPFPAGGLSGRPMFEKSTAVLRFLAERAPKEMILIGTGGIYTAEDAWAKLEAGANLCQLYTGWVYGGPNLVPSMNAELVAKLGNRKLAGLFR